MAPWLYLGWRSVRHENDKFISAFIALSLLMLAGWGSLFFSATLRWEFTEWKFFATMIVASIVFLVMTTVLGVVCWYNFDKGLKKFCKYLYFCGIVFGLGIYQLINSDEHGRPNLRTRERSIHQGVFP